MGPIVIDIDPVIVHPGPFALRWYGLTVLAAVVAGLWLTGREANRKGLPEGLVGDLAIWVVPGGLIGARLLHVIDRWPAHLANPAAALAISEGGLAIQGAILGGLLAGAVALRQRDLRVAPVIDAVAPGLLLGQAIGRIGCLITGDAVGAPTTLPWGVVYTNPAAMAPQLGAAYQPAFAYEALWDLAALAVLWRLRTRLRPDGAILRALPRPVRHGQVPGQPCPRGGHLARRSPAGPAGCRPAGAGRHGLALSPPPTRARPAVSRPAEG